VAKELSQLFISELGFWGKTSEVIGIADKGSLLAFRRRSQEILPILPFCHSSLFSQLPFFQMTVEDFKLDDLALLTLHERDTGETFICQ
jgi:hypothetical protein